MDQCKLCLMEDMNIKLMAAGGISPLFVKADSLLDGAIIQAEVAIISQPTHLPAVNDG